MNPKTNQLHESDKALCRSAMYEALALGFRSPTVETIDRLCDPEQNLALAEIAEVLDRYPECEEPLRLSPQIRALGKSPEAGNLADLWRSYSILFGHTAQSAAPPYETEYGEETLFQQPQQLGDIAGFCAAFGLQSDASERIDHISCECEFLSFLTRKEAFAVEEADADMLNETRKAQRLFLKDHLARFVPSFANLLERQAPRTFYGILGRLASEFVRSECVRFNVPVGPSRLRLRPVMAMDAGDSVFGGCSSCGSGEELLQVSTGRQA